MEIGGHRVEATPLYESGDAPRYFVHDIERVDPLGDGNYSFVFTCQLRVDGQIERRVMLYIDAPWRVVARGIVLAVSEVVELTCLRNVIAQVQKAVRRLTVH